MKKFILSDVCNISSGGTPSRKNLDFFKGDIPWAKISDIESAENGIINETDEHISVEGLKNIRGKIFPKGTLLFAMYGSIGKVAITGKKLSANQAILGICPKEDNQISLNYLKFWFATNKQKLINQGRGVALKNLSATIVRNLEIQLPPYDDQKRIAKLLGKVEGLINQRKKNIRQLDDLLKSVFLDMFSPNSKDYESWPLKEIKDLAAPHKRSMRTGPFGSNLKHDEFTVDGEVAVLGIDNAVKNSFTWSERRFISKEKYQELKNYTIFPGDVIITIMGTIGRSAVIPDDIPLAINTKHLAAITLDKDLADPIFISYSIHSSPYILNQFKSKNRGAIMSGLNLGIIKETKIKQPPIELQKKFAEIHTKVEKIKADYLNNLKELESLYGALSQKAFKGELDLSKVPLPDEIEETTDDMSSVDQDNIAEHKMGNSILGFSQFSPESIKDNDLRKTQLSKWFTEWLEHYQQESDLNIKHFWQCIEFTTQDYVDENDEPLKINVSDYDHIKAEVFAAIKSGVIKQTTNMIETVVDGKTQLEPGNQILLKKQH